MSGHHDTPPHRAVRASGRVYRGLLRLMPGGFRAGYGEPTMQTFLDLCTDEMVARGRRGLLRAWRHALPDLLAGATREWAGTLSRSTGDRPPAGARLAAAALPVTGALLIVYSQLRFPANLSRPSYAAGYAVLLAMLGLLAVRLLISRDAWPLPVLCALGTAPGWLLAFHLHRAGAGAVALLPVCALLVLATGWQPAGPPTVLAGLRTGAVTGVLAGLVTLVVNLVDGLATIGTASRDTVYVSEFVHSGQSSLAAYVIGERIGGGGYAIVSGALIGAAIGLAAGTVRALAHHRGRGTGGD